MKYWFVHIILIGLLVSIWVPTMTTTTYEQHKVILNDTLITAYPIDIPPLPAEAQPTEAAGTPDTFSSVIGNLKELLSLLIMVGNLITFGWQYKDRKRKNS